MLFSIAMEGEGNENNQVTLEDSFKLFKQMKNLYETLSKMRELVVMQSPAPSTLSTTPTVTENQEAIPELGATLSSETQPSLTEQTQTEESPTSVSLSTEKEKEEQPPPLQEEEKVGMVSTIEPTAVTATSEPRASEQVV